MRVLIISFFLALTVSSYAYGQELGQVKFLVDVENGYFEIVINDTLYLKRYKDSLPEGSYKAEVWSPGYITTDVSFKVVANKTTEVNVAMARSNDYAQYEYDYAEYRQKFHKSLTLPLSLSLTSACYTGAVMIQMFKFKKETNLHIADYYLSSNPQEIQTIKEEVEFSNKKFLRNRAFFYTGLATSGLLLGITTYTYRRFLKNNSEPTYNKDSPFADKFSVIPNYNGVTLRLKLG